MDGDGLVILKHDVITIFCNSKKRQFIQTQTSKRRVAVVNTCTSGYLN